MFLGNCKCDNSFKRLKNTIICSPQSLVSIQDSNPQLKRLLLIPNALKTFLSSHITFNILPNYSTNHKRNFQHTKNSFHLLGTLKKTLPTGISKIFQIKKIVFITAIKRVYKIVQKNLFIEPKAKH